MIILYVIVQCPVQPGSTECGYYMLRFMKEIVEEGIEVLVKDNVRIQHSTFITIIYGILTVTEYFNMLFFINKNNMQMFSQIGDGKAEYTTADIDEIREEWSTFVTGFIYR